MCLLCCGARATMHFRIEILRTTYGVCATIRCPIFSYTSFLWDGAVFDCNAGSKRLMLSVFRSGHASREDMACHLGCCLERLRSLLACLLNFPILGAALFSPDHLDPCLLPSDQPELWWQLARSELLPLPTLFLSCCLFLETGLRPEV